MKKYLLLLLPTVLCFGFSFSQKQNNIWYFGDNAGVDFASGSPVALTNGQTMTTEGTSTVSDNNGNLMFYTDGVTVWDNTHNPMPNGNGLFGNSSSTQSALIIPQPGSSTIYFIFTTDAYGGNNGCCYSIVDMSLNGGLGDVTIKNVQLHNPTTEKLIACSNSNGIDYWVFTHMLNSNSYEVFPVTSAGVGVPVTTAIGSIHTGNSCYGQMSYSCPNNKVACVVRSSDTIDLLDFDPSTGILSNPCNISNLTGIPYGLAFSPNGNYLYTADYQTGTLFQFDVTSGVCQTINGSSQTVGSTGILLGTMQLAVDNKIYVAEAGTSIGVINDPDLSGTSCNFVSQAVPVNGAVHYGLQNFPVCAYWANVPTAAFTAPNHICPGTCTDFVNTSTGASSYLWMFPGANPSTSTDQDPAGICYNTPGSYSVTLIAGNGVTSDTLTLNNFITVYPYPPPQGILQSGDTLFANQGATSYQWYYNGNIIVGATNYFYVATASGDYNVVATDENDCEVEAVINNVIAAVGSGSRQAIQIFPNPVTETIDIRGLENSSADEIKIFNVFGEKVFSAVDCKLPIANCQLPSGLYYIEITSDKKIYRAKFLKQ